MDWLHYFPFAEGTPLDLRARAAISSVKGSAEVLRNQNGTLTLMIDIPEQRVLFALIPEIKGTVSLEFRSEGGGNSAAIDINGNQLQDNDVIMTPNHVRRRMNVDPSVDLDGNDVEFKFRWRSDDRCDIEVSGVPIVGTATVRVTRA